MEDLINAFRKFLIRDMSFIVGGGSVIISFLFVYDHKPQSLTPFGSPYKLS